MDTARSGPVVGRTEELRRECRATMERLAKINAELQQVRAKAQKNRDFVRWQRYFGYDPVAAKFFENLDYGESE